MLQLKSIFFTVLLAAGVLSQGEEANCPDRATECPDNCGGAQCPRFLNAECQTNPCHGLCTPNFIWKGNNVTDRCGVLRCVDRECAGLRQCVEEVEPPSCPGNSTQCRQYIRTRCILPPPPTNCSQITCGPGMYCRQRKRRIGVKCAIARNCNQLTCSDGLTCTQTLEGPVCGIATPFPNFCDFCSSLGQICQVVDGSYRCTEAETCDQLNCESIVPGYVCEQRNDSAVCVIGCSAEFIEICASAQARCEVGTDGFPTCVAVSTQQTCDKVVCTEGNTCIQISFPSRNFSTAQCILSEDAAAIPTLEDVMCPAPLVPGCPEARLCTDVFQDGLFASPTCSNFTTDCTDDTSCGFNETCLDVPPDLRPALMFDSACIPSEFMFEFGTRCASGSRQCPAGLVCLDTAFEGKIIGTSCGTAFPPDAVIASSCAELEPCEESLECIESTISGRGSIAQCIDKESADDLFEIYRLTNQG